MPPAMSAHVPLNQQLCIATTEGAILVYWQHHLKHFDWLIQKDQSLYHTELVNICKDLHDGLVTSVATGEAMFVSSGTILSERNTPVALHSVCYTIKVE